MAEDRMLNDEILLGLIKKNGGGGGGGTTNYNSLSNKPQINSVELSGNKSLSDLGIASAQDVKKEFIGTMDEWDALSPAQKKAFDTYQITNDYSEALLPNYSTVEQKTGQKWIDGKDIYSKTVDCGALPDNTSKLVAAGLNNVTVIKIEGVAIGGSSIQLPHISTNSVYIEISYEASNEVFIRTNGYFSTMHGYVTLYYTKTA